MREKQGRDNVDKGRTNTHAANDAGSSDRRVDDWDHVRELALKHTVKVLGTADGHEAVAVGEARKHADLIRVLKLGACEWICSARGNATKRTDCHLSIGVGGCLSLC